MTQTLSQMIDSLVMETLKPDLWQTMESYANQVVRELHQTREGNAIGFKSNRIEAVVGVDTDGLFVWEIPRWHRFQFMEAVWYDSIQDYVDESAPGGRLLRDRETRYWYRSGDTLVFNGHHGMGDVIRLSYFEYPRTLSYYKKALRPASFDTGLDAFTYLPEFNVDAATRKDALDRTTNWLLMRHSELVLQGIRAKLYARLRDESRARVAYAGFKELQPGLVSTEEYQQAIQRRP